jgi:hypothetical protein
MFGGAPAVILLSLNLVVFQGPTRRLGGKGARQGAPQGRRVKRRPEDAGARAKHAPRSSRA